MGHKLRRRHLLAALAAGAGAAGLPALQPRRARSDEESLARKFLIVVTGFGGASIIDSFMPVIDTEVTVAGGDFALINCFPLSSNGSPGVVQKATWGNGTMRAVNWTDNMLGGSFTSDLEGFVDAHIDDMLVCSMTGTSVNHTVAQKRAITGNGAWNGRTLPEAVAMAYGQGCPLPNVNMGSHGYAQHGDDQTLAEYAIAEPVSVPTLWPFSLHGSRGVKIDDGTPQDGPSDAFIQMARELRNTKLDPESSFYTTFQLSQKLQRYKEQRNVVQPKLEAADLISKLMLKAEGELPLSAYGLESSPELAAVTAAFPRLDHDPLHTQAALAYLLITQGVSVAVTIGTNFNITLTDGTVGEPLILNPPLSFDNSHTDHRTTQAFMWQRILDVVHNLIVLLQAADFEGTGESYWDRTMIYCATDFGRSKQRDAASPDEFGSGHDLNNGVLAISPMLNGGRVLGGVDPTTALTYGFDPVTGAETALGDHMNEQQIFGGLVNALGIDTTGAVADMPIMRA